MGKIIDALKNISNNIIDISKPTRNDIICDTQNSYKKIVDKFNDISDKPVEKIVNKIKTNMFNNKQQNIAPTYFDIEFEKVIKTSFLLSQNNKLIRDNSLYPSYLLYEYKLINPSQYHIQLINEGYFQKAKDIDVLKSLKVDDLKMILKENGLKITGKKDVLIMRINESLDKEKLHNYLSNEIQIYTLSDKGVEFLKDNNLYLDYHKNHSRYRLNFKEFIETRDKLSFKAKFNDIAFAILSKRKTNASFKLSDINDLSDAYQNLYFILKEENNLNEAIPFLLSAFYINISGANEINRLSFYSVKEFLEDIKKNPQYAFNFSPGLIYEIIENKSYIDDDMINNMFITKSMRSSCCSLRLFKSIIKDMCSNTIFRQDKYYNLLFNDLKKRI